MAGTRQGMGGLSSSARAAIFSIVSNTFLIALKLTGGLITGSVALLSDGVQSIADLIASVIAFVAVRIADEPADTTHPFGHDKFENLSAVIEALLMFGGAVLIATQGVNRLIHPARVSDVRFGLAVVIVAGSVNLAMSTYLARVANRHGSPALRGDAAHLRTDAYVSFGVLGSLLLVELTGLRFIDPAVAIVVAIVIGWTGARIAWESIRVLLDEAATPEQVQTIRDVIQQFRPQGVLGYHQLRTRRGARPQVTMHLQFEHGMSLEEAHTVAHRIETIVDEKLRGADVLIHLEPEGSLHPDEALEPS